MFLQTKINNNKQMTLIDNASMVGFFQGDTRGAGNAFQLLKYSTGKAIVRTLHHAQEVVATETQYVAKTEYYYVMMCHPDARVVIFNMIELAIGVYKLNIYSKIIRTKKRK